MKLKLEDIYIETDSGLLPLEELTYNDWDEIIETSAVIDNVNHEKRIIASFILWVNKYNFMNSPVDNANKNVLN